MTHSITIDFSEENESTSYPWWVILDPKRLPVRAKHAADLVSCITGPFPSREEAQAELDSRPREYGKFAEVWCLSGFRVPSFRRAHDLGVELRKTTEELREKARKGKWPGVFYCTACGDWYAKDFFPPKTQGPEAVCKRCRRLGLG